MKGTTQSILNILSNENFSKISEFKEKVVSFAWDKTETQEMTFEESTIEFLLCIDILQSSINDESAFFDQSLSFSERNNILSYISTLDQYISNIKNGSNQVINFIQYVQNLKDLIKNARLEEKIKGYPSYHEKLKQVNYLKVKYEEMISKLEKSDTLYQKSETILANIEAMETSLNTIKNTITEQGDEITAIEGDTKTRYENIKTLNSNIIQYDADLKTIKSSIEKFFADIASNELKIKENTALIATNITKNDSETKRIVGENDKLQNEIYDILGKAIGTNLYRSFNVKSNWMFGQSIFWLIVLGGSIYFLTDSGRYIFESLKPFFETGKITDLSLTFYLRLTLIFPAIYAVYFSASEFKGTNRLREEYDFKSAVAVGLHYFKDLVEKTTDDKDKQFLIDSIKQVFSSPTEKAFGKKMNESDLNKKAKDIVSDIADIASNFTNKVLPK